MSASPSQNALLAKNRKARHNYHIIDTLEAGIALAGTEVKSIRNHEFSLEEAFAVEHNGEIFLHNLHIRPYTYGNRYNHDPIRIRRLLLHKREIRKLAGQLSREGLTLVPLDLHLRRGKIKLTLGLAKGKTHGDKRQTLKKREHDRDAQRAIKEANLR